MARQPCSARSRQPALNSAKVDPIDRKLIVFHGPLGYGIRVGSQEVQSEEALLESLQ